MTLRQLVKIGLSFLLHPKETRQAMAAGQSRQPMPMLDHARMAADWLLQAQENAPDGDGYSRKFSLIHGWDRCYIETTGYIIPSLLDVATRLGDEKYRASAHSAAEWLLSVQREDGAFTDIDRYEPHVFDTGQVLLGLNRMIRETGEARFLEAAQRAARWLVDHQDADGAWRRFAYDSRPHSYYSRVGAALIETGMIADDKDFILAGGRNLEWTAGQRQPDGWFAHCAFRPGEDALLHTIVYVLEGFVMAHDLTGEARWRDLALEGARKLASLENSAGLLASQYAPGWRATNREVCVTGLAQYAGLCFDAARLGGETDFTTRGARALARLTAWQIPSGANITGALPGSIPVWGHYGCMEFLNWNAKFFLDAGVKAGANKTMGHPRCQSFDHSPTDEADMSESRNPNAAILDKVLHDVTNCAAQAGITLWAECGTLLGIIRDQDYIPWEADLDFGARAADINPDQAISFKELMSARDYRVTVHDSYWHVAIPDGECHADINLYNIDDNSLIATVPLRGPGNSMVAKAVHSATCIVDQKSLGIRPESRRRRDAWKIRLQRFCATLPNPVRATTTRVLEKLLDLVAMDVSWRVPANLIAQTRPHEFRGVTIRLPVESERLLANRYGDGWRTPRRDWNTWTEDGAIVSKPR